MSRNDKWALLYFLLGFLAALMMFAGCGPVSADGGGSIYLGPCEIIVGGELGTLPRQSF